MPAKEKTPEESKISQVSLPQAKETTRSRLLKELFIARTQATYHTERRRFYTFWSRVLTFFTLVTTSSAVVLYLGGPTSQPVEYFGLATVVLFAIDLLTGPALRAGEHAVLSRRYLHAEQAIVARLTSKSRSEQSQRDFLEETISERLAIEADEPPLKRWLSIWSHNQIVMSQGRGTIYKIGWFQERLSNWLDFKDVTKVEPSKRI